MCTRYAKQAQLTPVDWLIVEMLLCILSSAATGAQAQYICPNGAPACGNYCCSDIGCVHSWGLLFSSPDLCRPMLLTSGNLCQPVITYTTVLLSSSDMQSAGWSEHLLPHWQRMRRRRSVLPQQLSLRTGVLPSWPGKAPGAFTGSCHVIKAPMLTCGETKACNFLSMLNPHTAGQKLAVATARLANWLQSLEFALHSTCSLHCKQP